MWGSLPTAGDVWMGMMSLCEGMGIKTIGLNPDIALLLLYI